MEFKVSGLFENDVISNDIYNIIKGKRILEIGGPSLNNYWIPKFYELSEYTDVINFSDDNNISLYTGCIPASKGAANSDYNDNLNIRNFYKLVINDSYEYLNLLENDYDIILTCHVLEHQANPIKQLLLWKKLLKDDGIFIHILPNKNISADCNRPITDFNKLLFNYDNNILEDDISEIDNIIKYKNNDPTKIPGITNIDNLIFLKNNPEIILKTQPIHHHVYDFNLLEQLANKLDLKQTLQFNIYLDNWVFWNK